MSDTKITELPDTETPIFEAMARAMCEADGFDPNEQVDDAHAVGKIITYPRWQTYLDEARRQYRAYRAMHSVIKFPPV